MSKRLVIDLVGRICMVTRKDELWAVFLKIPPEDKEIAISGKDKLLDHYPLLSVPLSMLDSNVKEAKGAVLTAVTRVKRLNEEEMLLDKMGIWRLDGQEITIEKGDSNISGTVDIVDAADLNAIVASVGVLPVFEPGVLAETNPAKFGITARLRLPKSADVTAVTEDRTVKTFVPGGHIQHLASFVRCKIPFAGDYGSPAIRLRPFQKDDPARVAEQRERQDSTMLDFRFNATLHDEVTVTMSNVCSCIEDYDRASDDPEFFVYYNLLKRPDELRGAPVPTSVPKIAARQIPICFSVARERLEQ